LRRVIDMKILGENTGLGDQWLTQPKKKSVVLLLIVAFIWILELFGVQALSFGFDYPVPLQKWVGAQVIRFLLDAFFCLGFIVLLPRVFSVVGFIVFLVFAQVAGYYVAVFGRALTLTTIQAQWADGLVGARFDWAYVNWVLFLAMLVTLVLKIWLLFRIKRLGFSRRTLCWTGGAIWVVYCMLVGFSMKWVDSPRKLRKFVTADRLGMTYGFMLLWAGEAVCLNQDQLLLEAVAQRANITDRLSAVEPPLKLTGDVVLIQVESLDWRVLNYHVDGVPVTPFLNRLADQAMLFKVTAFHTNGSGDTDFVMLNAVPPSPMVMTYVLARYPYSETLPQIAERAGYTTAAFHGNSGRFFAREQAFKSIGFDALWFLEELRDICRLPVSLWGIRDDEVLAFSQKLLQKKPAAQPQLHYIITLTSHQPFIYLEPAERTFLPGASSMLDRYFDSMNFVDRNLETYINGLKHGTLVIIFGDHRAMVGYGAAAGSDDCAEYVPLFIHRVGEQLAARQSSRTLPLACSGELTMLDAASYIHRLFRKML
jgi:glucan phosphoethanolaminetransferase (alkaline phosphatase superfamily)